MHLPVLYSYRRCPYAIRARLALWQAGIPLQLCDLVSLRQKPEDMLRLSPKGTVPVLHLPQENRVIDQSLDIMLWALTQHDPDGWLQAAPMADMLALIARNDGPFKQSLDGYKYPERHPQHSQVAWRDRAWQVHLQDLEQRLTQHPYLMGSSVSLADVALLPFVRQFAQVDRAWFDAAPNLPATRAWLHAGVHMPLFDKVMAKTHACPT